MADSLRGGAAVLEHNAVERRAGVTHREFVAEYLHPLKPVILTDAIDGWRARTRWTFDFFAAEYGSRTVAVDGRQYQLSALIDAVKRSAPGATAPYLRNLLIERWAPELLKDIDPLPACTRPNWLDSRFFPGPEALTSVELYIGGAGAAFPVLHYDNLHTHAFLMQLEGVKEYIFYPPSATPFLYPRGGSEENKSSIDDIEQPDLNRFPAFRQAVATRCHLHPGETLFVPAGWWHTARILSASITVSANTANAVNWAAFTRDYVASVARHRSTWYARMIAAYLTVFSICGQLVST
ncbi:MAG TPA: cupin-like domain-containing protein [Vicinamibacterales bacterium]|nr:cupin-like domain-containing protein [Vicinamibacterales bacterium]